MLTLKLQLFVINKKVLVAKLLRKKKPTARIIHIDMDDTLAAFNPGPKPIYIMTGTPGRGRSYYGQYRHLFKG